METKIRIFLEQSNYIEGEYSNEALEDACLSWSYLIKQDMLSRENILETHRILMERCNPHYVPIGKFRDFNVRVGSKICPEWEKIDELFKVWLQNCTLIQEHLFYLNPDNTLIKVPIDAVTPQIRGQHVGFERIHPFGDGNGRLGRIIMNWQRVKAGLPILVIYEKDKYEYYKWF